MNKSIHLILAFLSMMLNGNYTGEFSYSVGNNQDVEGSGETVPLIISATMPVIRSLETGELAVNMHVPMKTQNISAFHLQPDYFNNAEISFIDFNVNAPDSRRMLTKPGSKWKGTATLYFDADFIIEP